jgi:hypothetical protein
MPTLRALCVLLFWAATAPGVETLAYIPAAAHAAGAAGSLWTTEVALFNPSRTEERQIGVGFLPRPGQTAPAELVVRLGPREAKTLVDVVAALGTSGGGALRLRSDGPIVASSRTFNSGSPSCGTFGTGVPAIPESAAVTAGVFPPLRAARINGLVSVRPSGTARRGSHFGRKRHGAAARVAVCSASGRSRSTTLSGLGRARRDQWAKPCSRGRPRRNLGDGTFLLSTSRREEARSGFPSTGLTWRIEDGFRATRTGSRTACRAWWRCRTAA